MLDWATVDSIHGWLTEPEGQLLYTLASLNFSHSPVIVEIGSYRGRSTACLASALRDRNDGVVIAVDPHEGCFEVGQENTFQDFLDNLAARELLRYVQPLRSKSENAALLMNWSFQCDLLFIDGDHRLESVERDVECWTPWLHDEGLAAFHDYRCYNGPTAVVNRMLETGWVQVELADHLIVLKRG